MYWFLASYHNCCSFILHHPELDPLILALVLIIFFVLLGLFFTTLMSHRRSVKLECITYYICTTNIVLSPSESQSFAKKIKFYIYIYIFYFSIVYSLQVSGQKGLAKNSNPWQQVSWTVYYLWWGISGKNTTTLYDLLVLVLIVL